LLVDEVAAYLEGADLGLVATGPNPNLFTVPFPLGGPDAAVCLIVFSATTLETFGESLSAPAAEEQNFKVISRGAPGEASAAQTKAYDVYKKLRRLGPVTLSGVLYFNIRAQPPMFLSIDDADRPRYHFDATAWKQES
jgi:hypothetical protein